MSVSAERDTLAAMISLFCKAHHQGEPPCASCRDLLRYAEERLGKCTYGAQKPTCRKCPIHCYRPEMRERITEVMKYAGPRMLIHHPVAALRHLLHERAPDARKTGDKQGRT
jgi:hypothetical protein